MTRERELYYSDKITMQKTVSDNLMFVEPESEVYTRLSSFVQETNEDPAQ